MRQHRYLMAIVALLGLQLLPTFALELNFHVEPNKERIAVLFDNSEWLYTVAPPTICVAGHRIPLKWNDVRVAKGEDKFGPWGGFTISFHGVYNGSKITLLEQSIQEYAQPEAASMPSSFVVMTCRFPIGLDTSGCGNRTQQIVACPAFDAQAKETQRKRALTWRGDAVQESVVVEGLKDLGANSLDAGPVVLVEMESWRNQALVISSLTSHKILPQNTNQKSWSLGPSAAIPSLPAGWSYSILMLASTDGVTLAMYQWGKLMQKFHSTYRIPSATLTDIGYYTDDGAYYYVWEAFRISSQKQNLTTRAWPAQKGLVLVKEALWESGVPVAYMQLDDWWYTGPFYFGNVKAVVNWTASTAPALFPDGLPAFAQKLGLPIQLYTPFWGLNYSTPYNMTENVDFPGTKLVTPKDSYAFFSDLFDLGLHETDGKMMTYEIDFMKSNFDGSPSMFESVHSASQWYRGMADAALERGIAIQLCLASVTDMLESLTLPAVVQARASSDYVQKELNALQIGGSSLIMGALAIAPSKDTLWTSSPQPPTMSDTENNGNGRGQYQLVGDGVCVPFKDWVGAGALDEKACGAACTASPTCLSWSIAEGDCRLYPQLAKKVLTSPHGQKCYRNVFYTTQPHVQLDAVLATLSMGPVGISDALGYTDVGLISQAFMSPTNSTLLRPSRPLSYIDRWWTTTELVAPDVRGTHAAVPDSDGYVSSHYLVAWRTTETITLGPTDLWPVDKNHGHGADLQFAIRRHIIQPTGTDGHLEGCVDGKPAVPHCVTIASRQEISIPATGPDLADFSLTVIYEPTIDGAYFLGELDKFVHVSPQRFAYVLSHSSTTPGTVGLTIGLQGSPGQLLTLVALDKHLIVRLCNVTVPDSGFLEVAM